MSPAGSLQCNKIEKQNGMNVTSGLIAMQLNPHCSIASERADRNQPCNHSAVAIHV